MTDIPSKEKLVKALDDLQALVHEAAVAPCAPNLEVWMRREAKIAAARMTIIALFSECSVLKTTAEGEIPAILFDGYSVLQMLTQQAKARTSAENVSDVLDALVRILCGHSPEKAPAPIEPPAPSSNQQASHEFRDGPIHAAALGQCIIIEANDPHGDDSEVCLNLSEARAFRRWLGIVLGETPAPTSNEQGPLWTPTFVVERLLRQTRLSTADQISMDRKQLEGLLFDVLRCRNDHSVGGVAAETPEAHTDWARTVDVAHRAVGKLPTETSDDAATATTCAILRTFERALVKIDTYTPSSTVQPVQIARDALREAYGPNYRSAARLPEKAACSTFIPMSPYDTEKCANCGVTELTHLKTGAGSPQ